jgi:hypothetical protein
MEPMIPHRTRLFTAGASFLLTLWLAKTTDPDVAYYVMDGPVEIGEVVELGEDGYVVRLDGPDGGDTIFVVKELRSIVREAQRRVTPRS